MSIQRYNGEVNTCSMVLDRDINQGQSDGNQNPDEFDAASLKSACSGDALPGQSSKVRIDMLEVSITDSGDSQHVHKTMSLHQSFGVAACVTLIGGTAVTLLVLGFLIFLWFGEGPVTGGEQASHVWRNIMLGEWLPQLITLSSLVMRLMIGAQASICTSMCAALILEIRKVLKSQAPQYSVIRALNDGPFNLIKLYLRQIPNDFSLHPEFILLVCLCLTALGTQFSSTILLSDLDAASVVQSPSTISLKLFAGPDINIDTSATEYWSDQPLSFPSFGETPPGYFAQPNQRGLSDTGVKRRALIPFYQLNDRTTLRSYDGNAAVISSRVACMPPKLLGAFTGANFSGLYYGNVAGEISYEETFAEAGIPSTRLCNSERCLASSFNCTIMSIDEGDTYVTTSHSFCVPQIIHEHKFGPSIWRLDDEPWGPEAYPILVMNSELYTDDWEEAMGKTISTSNSAVEEEWKIYDLGLGKSTRITLCFMGLNVMPSDVRLRSAEKVSVGKTEETVNKSAQVMDTTNIQRLLGADPAAQDFRERGVFQVEQIIDDPNHVFFPDKDRELSIMQNTTSIIEAYLIYNAQAMKANTTTSVCIRCTGNADQAANPLYANLFASILRASNRPAAALQSIYTVLGQFVYYDILAVFDEPHDAVVVKTQAVRIPRRSRGIVAVVALVLTCLCCVWAVAGLFWKHSRHTLLGETWHAVSQLVSRETRDVMNGSDTLRDKDVRLRLVGDDPYVRLEQSLLSGKVEIVRCN
ncbi:hypothetical protein GGR53DRAFT_332380 [Hypoxylon sp. FL1150]|nr:hypothetical protein GGR53DRAFT_332380 [Hypoxylon sp. FL1150]